jgi:Tol biopolymer transport system component
MMRVKSICFVVIGLSILTTVGAVSAAEPALWLRYPAISPDGSTIAFSYRGDLWTVPSGGGRATPLTVHAAHDTRPVWSPDGSAIAFASDRYGNFDVYSMPASGGTATRLTYHSVNDYPTSFTPEGENVLFSSARLNAKDCVQFPTGAQPELYRVSLAGGMPTQVLTTPASFAVYDEASQRLAYSDEKSYEDEWRKHDFSSFARDVWLYDVETGKHTRLTDFGADDRQPVWAPGEDSIYYLSERDGTFNVWQLSLDPDAQPVQITRFDTHPVRFLSASRDGDLSFSWDGEIFMRSAGATENRKIGVFIASDRRHNEVVWTDVTRNISEFELSPDGKEIAFISRGEVFVTSTKHGTTKRITNTPEQERSVSFSPEGRSLLYASERNGSWNLYRTDLEDEDEPSFFNATAFKETPVLEIEAETFQPRFSPDGKEVAYLEDRIVLKVLNLASADTRTVMPGKFTYSYRDGDQWYEWSPDGKWFLVQYFPINKWGDEEVGLLAADGSAELENLTRSGYWDMQPRWAMNGEMMFWISDRYGSRALAGWANEYDVFGAFFTRGRTTEGARQEGQRRRR